VAKKGSAALEKGRKMDNQKALIKKIDEFSVASILSVKRLRDECLNDPPLLTFHDKIVDLYVNNITVLYNLSGFLENLNGATPFLGKTDLQDPCRFIKELDIFIGNCLLDDASYYCLWLKEDKKPRIVAGRTFNLPYRNERGKFVSIPCEPFDKEGNPIIIADYSGDEGGQDVDLLNKVVDFAINKEVELQKRIKNLPGFKNGQ
jgi:hypothetical protein